MIKRVNKIVISRTDSIGDVVLTLPLAGIIKERFPTAKIIFFGNTYTKPIIACCQHVDEIWEWATISAMPYKEQVKWLREQNIDVFLHIFPRKEIAKLAKKAKVRNRVGTSHRLFHWLTCNYRPNFTRKKSDKHEAQLNTKLLEPLRIGAEFSLNQLSEYIAFTKIPELPKKFSSLLSATKTNVILHPKSQGSAVEWGVKNFMDLAEGLDPEKYTIFITGTEKEAESFRNILPQKNNIHDLSGKMTLNELISFISNCDVLVAASTGPLHIAGVTNINTIGLFSEKKPIHAGRWKPLGKKVITINCEKSLDFTQPLFIPLRVVLKAVENTAK